MTVESSGTCRAAIERLVESGGRPPDRETEEHVGSCMACFRAMSDLRDVPRVADALRAAEPAVPADARFWETLAQRTTDAVAAGLAGESVAPVPLRPAPVARPRSGARARFVSFGALAVAAAAGWALMVRHPAASRPAAATPVAAAAAAPAGRLAGDDSSGEALGEVAQMDASGLRQLLDRLGRQAPAALASDTSDGLDAADVPSDDEPRVSDEVADLDGEGLRRVAVSLAGAAL